jgi:hypothetical protein
VCIAAKNGCVTLFIFWIFFLLAVLGVGRFIHNKGIENNAIKEMKICLGSSKQK